MFAPYTRSGGCYDAPAIREPLDPLRALTFGR